MIKVTRKVEVLCYKVTSRVGAQQHNNQCAHILK